MENPKNIEEQVKCLKEDVEGLTTLLQKILSPDGKIDLTLTVQELVVRMQNNGAVTVTLDTHSTGGRIIYCAVKDLEQKPFGYAEMLGCLDEHGWHVESKAFYNAINPLITKGLIIKEQKNEYHLPSKVSFVEA